MPGRRAARAGPTGRSSTSSTATRGRQSESHWGPREGTGTETLVAGGTSTSPCWRCPLGMVPARRRRSCCAADPAWRRHGGRRRHRGHPLGPAVARPRRSPTWGGPARRASRSAASATPSTPGPPCRTCSPGRQWPSTGAPAEPRLPLRRHARRRPGTRRSRRAGALARFLDDEVGALWPDATGPSGFRWDLLWDDQDRERARSAGRPVPQGQPRPFRPVRAVPAGLGQVPARPGRDRLRQPRRRRRLDRLRVRCRLPWRPPRAPVSSRPVPCCPDPEAGPPAAGAAR